MFWICAESSIDHAEMFSTLLSSVYRVKALSDSHITPPVSRLGMYKNLGGDTDTADPNSAKGYSIPYGVLCSI